MRDLARSLPNLAARRPVSSSSSRRRGGGGCGASWRDLRMFSAGARHGKRGELGENPAGAQAEAFRHDLIVFGQGACHVEKVETGAHGADLVHGRPDFPRRTHEVAAAREESEEGVAQGVRFLFIGEVFLRAADRLEDPRHGPGGVFGPEGGQNVVPKRHVEPGRDPARKRPGTFTAVRGKEEGTGDPEGRRILRGGAENSGSRVAKVRGFGENVGWQRPCA